jgi:hypothetical protein
MDTHHAPTPERPRAAQLAAWRALWQLLLCPDPDQEEDRDREEVVDEAPAEEDRARAGRP